MDVKLAGVALEAVDDGHKGLLRVLYGLPLYRELCRWEVFNHWSRRWPGVIDLHKFTRTVAGFALSMVMEDMLVVKGKPPPHRVHQVGQDLVMIVGKSGHVIRERVRHYFEVECRPPLPVSHTDGNEGRVVVKSRHLRAWVQAQSKQREAVIR